MNILPRLALCNGGCSDRSASAGSKPMRLLKMLVCGGSQSGAARAEHHATDVGHILRSVATALGLGIVAALLIGALLSDEYGRGMQVQASGYSALSDKVAGTDLDSALHSIAQTPDAPPLPKRTGL